jgi:hypothetical protein
MRDSWENEIRIQPAPSDFLLLIRKLWGRDAPRVLPLMTPLFAGGVTGIQAVREDKTGQTRAAIPEADARAQRADRRA